MFRFEHPGFFWLLLVPVVFVLFYYARQRMLDKAWKLWGTEASNQKAISQIQIRPSQLWMGITGIALISLGAINPQWGFRKASIENKSAELYIALDISTSMLAEDIAPNRLERAKRLAMDISSAFKTDKVGLIVFAGNAYIQSPLTTDWHAIQLYLNSANPDQAGTQGTAIGDAVKMAMASKEENETGSGGAIIILTDGEDHDSAAEEMIRGAYERGWTTYLIGVGTDAGSTIPVMIEGNRDLKRDEHGQPVRTKLNESLMKQLATEGHGRYFNISEGIGIVNELQKELSSLERSRLEKRSFSEHKSYYQWFLLPGLLLIMGWVGLNFKFDVV